MKKFGFLCSVCALLVALPSGDAFAATKKASKQSAIQKGTSVRAKTSAAGRNHSNTL